MTFWALILCAFIALPSGTKSFTSSRFIIGSQADLSTYSCRATIKSIEAIVENPLQKTSPAELVDRALSYEDVMIATCSLVYPGEESLHYQIQSVHQRKRQKVAANALKRLVKFLVGVSVESERKKVVEDDRFYRLCMCATAPVHEKFSTSGSSPYWETRSDVSSYLDAVYCLGALAPLPQKVTVEAINPLLIQLNQILSDRSSDHNDGLSQFKLKPTEISSLEWAVQRMSRVAPLSDNRENENEMTQDKSAAEKSSAVLPSSVSNAISSVKKLQLPFEVLHGVVKGITSIEEMRRMVPFKSDTLLTRDGKQVSERRETCWMADEGIGGLAYSGKIMTPVPFTHNVAAVRDAIEKDSGIYYDCCLINWYDDGECACKFHSDPDHGRLWSHDTVVVSIGETRRFNLREIPATVQSSVQGMKSKIGGKEIPKGEKGADADQDHYSFHLFDGDVFYMGNGCQDDFQHCVMKSEGDFNNAPRSSIVFKKSLPGPGGRRGHGILGARSGETKDTNAAPIRSNQMRKPLEKANIARSVSHKAVKSEKKNKPHSALITTVKSKPSRPK